MNLFTNHHPQYVIDYVAAKVGMIPLEGGGLIIRNKYGEPIIEYNINMRDSLLRLRDPRGKPIFFLPSKL